MCVETDSTKQVVLSFQWPASRSNQRKTYPRAIAFCHIDEFRRSELSYPARLAMDKQSPLKLKGEAWEISTAEFRFETSCALGRTRDEA